ADGYTSGISRTEGKAADQPVVGEEQSPGADGYITHTAGGFGQRSDTLQDRGESADGHIDRDRTGGRHRDRSGLPSSEGHGAEGRPGIDGERAADLHIDGAASAAA